MSPIVYRLSAIARRCGQILVITGLFAAVATFSDWPSYRQFPIGSGVVMLSFVHGADRRADCRRLTAEEIAKLAPNMRRTEECPRRRRSIYVELDLNGRTVYQAFLAPSGIAGDGPSRAHQRFVVPAAPIDVAVRMRDTARQEGFDHVRSGRISLAPDQMFVIDFNSITREFIFR